MRVISIQLLIKGATGDSDTDRTVDFTWSKRPRRCGSGNGRGYIYADDTSSSSTTTAQPHYCHSPALPLLQILAQVAGRRRGAKEREEFGINSREKDPISEVCVQSLEFWLAA